MQISGAIAVCFLAVVASAMPGRPLMQSLEMSAEFVALSTIGNSTFQQLLNHSDPSMGSFSQSYWYNFEFWDGPGSPIVLFTPGEDAADGYTGYVTNKTLPGAYGQAIEGAVIMLEHRYWGTSSPYDYLDTEALQLLNLDQAISDLLYFANTVDLPFDTNHSSNAQNAPWVMTGGSCSGALSAWTASLQPGTFWAYHASSAPVQAIDDFWQYFYPIQQGMPQNCSSDVTLVIDHIDSVLTNGTGDEICALKKSFGLDALEHNDDFASALQNGLWAWQSNEFYTGYSNFYQFCDAVENAVPGSNTTTSATGVGLEKALAGYANWINGSMISGFCQHYGASDERDVSCLDTYNASSPMYTDYTVGNPWDRQWMWLLCNEPLDYWQDSAPIGTPTVVSRLITPKYWLNQCNLLFPEVNGYTYGSSNPDINVDTVNDYTGGWDLEDTTRLMWTNGEYDPWRSASVSSEFRPGGPLSSTAEHPVQVIPKGIHCSDMILRNGRVNAGVQTVIDNEIAQIKAWVDEYYT
ncbi:putative extracellular serine carboxypeptidase [Lachnellula suecica]|uniref:Putative extracellular serine carboxypeptidase n=1 Tax=Lachnellula suecica TaxID=602035 RepID=A0A8T9BYS9_9HELO|nr:putative extracellular serine carboxypeptidase [Lachnellula suecica]